MLVSGDRLSEAAVPSLQEYGGPESRAAAHAHPRRTRAYGFRCGMVRVAMPPSSRFARRCLVFLLPAGTDLLARPLDADKRPFVDIVDSASRRHGVDPDPEHAGEVR